MLDTASPAADVSRLAALSELLAAHRHFKGVRDAGRSPHNPQAGRRRGVSPYFDLMQALDRLEQSHSHAEVARCALCKRAADSPVCGECRCSWYANMCEG